MRRRRDGGGAPTGQPKTQLPTPSYVIHPAGSGHAACKRGAEADAHRARHQHSRRLQGKWCVASASPRSPALAPLTHASVVPMLNASRTLIVRPHRYRSGLQDHLALLHISAPNGTGFICTPCRCSARAVRCAPHCCIVATLRGECGRSAQADLRAMQLILSGQRQALMRS